ncbi:peptidyl-tRNA hydrolase [Nocardia sp. alder85J]|uniref:peptidyl-tRNA hydrolase n=1 Tax=Nocardia sp. alder85J TaxID=2862949 RepID=UPI001CD62166|nr:peptidyl-tRNA hydrolase [Nocardia sp. alder85J]MCX4095292.1 peptidyl-tRNA hydrolase [Nocardia sp. alder85J]
MTAEFPAPATPSGVSPSPAGIGQAAASAPESGSAPGSDDPAAFRARHAELARGYGGGGDPADPALVQAMQMVLHIPKNGDQPRRSDLLAAAATAAVALCLDPRVGLDGVWEQRYLTWKRSRIRKVARRARGAQWLAAAEVDGVTVEVNGAQARALVPGPVGAVDPRIRRLQIGGTDLEHDEPGPPDPTVPVLWIDADLGMTVGKAAAQVGHASMLLAGALSVDAAFAWSRQALRCSVREATGEQWAALCRRVREGTATAVRDAGFTEVAPGSMTVIAVPAARPPEIPDPDTTSIPLESDR